MISIMETKATINKQCHQDLKVHHPTSNNLQRNKVSKISKLKLKPQKIATNDKLQKHKGKWLHTYYPLTQLQNKNVVFQYQRKIIMHQLHINYGQPSIPQQFNRKEKFQELSKHPNDNIQMCCQLILKFSFHKIQHTKIPSSSTQPKICIITFSTNLMSFDILCTRIWDVINCLCKHVEGFKKRGSTISPLELFFIVNKDHCISKAIRSKTSEI